ncbi:MAG TPA: FecR family protein [Xanthobacteraceae bacterium]|nr:FecR family protein [Xanthobacteraceae bacterium]
MESGRIRMLYRLTVVAAIVLSSIVTGLAAAQEAIGTVTRMQGQASATRESATRPLDLNASVFLNEVVSTGEAARLQLTFADNTLMTLGENTRLTLDRYVFNPGAGRGIIRFRVDGAFRFLSGQVSKLARASVIVTTRVANIGVRGTEFWAGPIDNLALGVLLIEGVVRVSNAAGERVLTQPGQGTNIATAGAAPGPVTVWPQDKANRALAGVTFQ